MEPWEMLREDKGLSGLAMSVNWRRSEGDLANKRFWLVDRVWLSTGIRSCDWIMVFSSATVTCAPSTVTRSRPSLLRMRSSMFGAVLGFRIEVTGVEASFSTSSDFGSVCYLRWDYCCFRGQNFTYSSKRQLREGLINIPRIKQYLFVKQSLKLGGGER